MRNELFEVESLGRFLTTRFQEGKKRSATLRDWLVVISQTNDPIRGLEVVSDSNYAGRCCTIVACGTPEHWR